jgi:hypothetical protein
MAYVEALGGRVGEHVQHIAAFFFGDRRVLCRLEGFVFFPVFLPLGFYGLERIHDE